MTRVLGIMAGVGILVLAGFAWMILRPVGPPVIPISASGGL